MSAETAHSLQYFLASLAGIARALDDFGYREEARQIFQVKKSLEDKAMPQTGIAGPVAALSERDDEDRGAT